MTELELQQSLVRLLSNESMLVNHHMVAALNDSMKSPDESRLIISILSTSFHKYHRSEALFLLGLAYLHGYFNLKPSTKQAEIIFNDISQDSYLRALGLARVRFTQENYIDGAHLLRSAIFSRWRPIDWQWKYDSKFRWSIFCCSRHSAKIIPVEKSTDSVNDDVVELLRNEFEALISTVKFQTLKPAYYFLTSFESSQFPKIMLHYDLSDPAAGVDLLKSLDEDDQLSPAYKKSMDDFLRHFCTGSMPELPIDVTTLSLSSPDLLSRRPDAESRLVDIESLLDRTDCVSEEEESPSPLPSSVPDHGID